MIRHLSMIVIAGLVFWAALPAAAQEDDVAASDDSIDDDVAAELLARGRILFDAGDFQNAKKMFAESLERGPNGPSSARALDMLRTTNGKLGLPAEHGRPSADAPQPQDPYADSGDDGGDKPMDPYGDVDGKPADGKTGGEPVVDPYADTETPPGDDGDDDGTTARRAFMAWSGGYGLLLGLALAGPENDSGEISGGALLVGALGAAGGVGLAHLALRRRPLEPGQLSATISAGTWGALNLALLGDALDCAADKDACATDTNSIYKLSAIGGLLGIAGGAYAALQIEPSEGDVAFVNSLGMYGTASGLLLGAAMDPPRAEAYSLNAFLGSSIGLAAGVVLARQVETSRRRMLLVDLGAAGGAAVPWVLLYPLIADGNSSSDEQVAGALSALTLAGGATAMWFLTRGTGDAPDGPQDAAEDEEPAVSMSLVQRRSGGRWSLSAPMVRPIENPVLAPATGGLSLGVDVLSGRF